MAFAAVISLGYTLECHIGRNGWIPKLEEMLRSLKEVLGRLDYEMNRRIDRSVINELDAKITEAAWKLEDVLQSYKLNQSLLQSDETPLVDKKVVEQEMDLFYKTAKVLRDEYSRELENPWPEEEEEDVVPMDDFVGIKSTMIGLWDQFEEIRNDLLDLRQGIKIVSLVGMAGIGKSHLARQIYQHPTIIQHFDLVVWVRLGVKHQVENIYLDILSQIERKPRNAYWGMSSFSLMHQLHIALCAGRCLVVLDDVWSTSLCSYLSFEFFKDQNRTTFLVTTRLEKVVEGHSNTIHKIRFLNNEESWDLLWRNVFFGEESFPPELEKAGRKIAENCEGLPLLILTVADILCRLDKTEEYWMKVANKKTTTFTDAYEKIEKVLWLSYDYMPQHLKACFLYMGVFPQTSKIPITKLFNLWTVEDFLESISFDFSNKCVEDLVSRSVVIPSKHAQCSTLRIKSCKLHSAYWYLCVKEARKNKFFHVLKRLSDASEEHMESQHRLSVQNNILFGIKEVYESIAASLTARSLLCTGVDCQYPVPICFNLPLLRVLDALAIRFYEFPEEVVDLVRLRYLALTHYGQVPSSICNLNQLECLVLRPHHHIRSPRVSTLLPMHFRNMRRHDISSPRDSTCWPMHLCNMLFELCTSPRVSTFWPMYIWNMWRHDIRYERDSTFLPMDIWYMPELRYLRITGSNLPDPIFNYAYRTNLETLYLNARSCTKAVMRYISYSLRKLVIDIELHPDTLNTLCEPSSCFKYIRTLEKLESLKCVVVNPWLRYKVVATPEHLSNLPMTLKKLSLKGLGYSWEYMTAIGSLPYLQVLKLRCSAFRGEEWETMAGEFRRLEFLVLEDIDLRHWRIDNDRCFQRLEQLVIGHCYKLKEIPQRIGDLPAMKRIELVDCSPSAVDSAKKKRRPSLKVEIDSSWSRNR